MITASATRLGMRVLNETFLRGLSRGCDASPIRLWR